MAEKILEKDVSRFRYKDVLGDDEKPQIVIIRYSAIEAAYLYVDIEDFTEDPAFLKYTVHSHPLVQSKNKWLLTQEYGYYWGRIDKVVENMNEKS